METKYTAFLVLIVFLSGCSTHENRQVVDGAALQRSREDLEHLYNEANENYKEKRFSAAILLLDSLIELDSLNADYFFKRGYSKAQIGKRESSTRDFLRAVDLDFKVSKAYHNIGMNEVVLGHDSLAAVYFRRALEADSRNTRAKEMLDLIEAKKH